MVPPIIVPLHQKNLHQMKSIMTRPTKHNGPYCFHIYSQLILTAACLYFLLSSLSLELISPILSKLSPRYNKSSIFFVITFVTSFSGNVIEVCEGQLPWVRLVSYSEIYDVLLDQVVKGERPRLNTRPRFGLLA